MRSGVTVVRRNAFLLLLVCAWLLVPRTALAGPAAELAEWMAKQGGRYADDLAGTGVKQVTRELETLSATVGDQVAEQLVKKGGPGALRAVRGLGDAAPDAARLIAKFGEPGKLLVEQGGKASVAAAKTFGDDGVRILLSQGTTKGGEMLATYGKPLAEHADTLSAESLAHLRRWMPEVEKAPLPWKQTFTAKLGQGGDDFVQWAARRWQPLAVTGGLAIAGITAYRVGDGVIAALPNPARDPLGWFVWWTPLVAISAIVVGGWVLRARLLHRPAA
jgi:hypothetical protein